MPECFFAALLATMTVHAPLSSRLSELIFRKTKKKSNSWKSRISRTRRVMLIQQSDNFQFATIFLKTQNTPHHASCKRTVRGVCSIMRLLSDTRSRRLSPHGQRRILRCRWYWKAVCPAPDTNRKRTCTPTCKAACRSVPPPWRTAAQSLRLSARRGSPRWAQSWNCWQREAFSGLPARLTFLPPAASLYR